MKTIEEVIEMFKKDPAGTAQVVAIVGLMVMFIMWALIRSV